MALKLSYMGQNDSVNCTPNVVLTGDPGVDQLTLTNAGYLGGRIVSLIGTSGFPTTSPVTTFVASNVESAIVPTDGDASGAIPFGVLLNGPGEFSGAIGPSGSKKAPIVRALWQGSVNNEAYDTANSPTFVVGAYLYVGGHTHSNTGLYTDATNKGASTAGSIPVGICTHVPSTAEPFLGVSSLL